MIETNFQAWEWIVSEKLSKFCYIHFFTNFKIARVILATWSKWNFSKYSIALRSFFFYDLRCHFFRNFRSWSAQGICIFSTQYKWNTKNLDSGLKSLYWNNPGAWVEDVICLANFLYVIRQHFFHLTHFIYI